MRRMCVQNALYPPVGFAEWQIDVLQTQYIIIYRIEQCEDGNGKVFKFSKLRIIAKIR